MFPVSNPCCVTSVISSDSSGLIYNSLFGAKLGMERQVFVVFLLAEHAPEL